MTIALIPCAGTEWQEQGRLMGRVELAPTPAGEAECLGWVERLRPLGLGQIRHAPDELARRTAELLGRRLLVPTKAVACLTEVDVGLWSGLTEAQLESRYSTAYRELCESPLNVSPPGGESLGAANARVKAYLRKQVRRARPLPLALVLRPILLAMAWCFLDDQDPSVVWEVGKRRREPVIVEFPVGPTLPGDRRGAG